MKFTRVRDGAKTPAYGTSGAAGADLYACLEADTVIGAGESLMVPTGIAVAIPAGYMGLVFARSGLATKHGLAPANKVGVIDSDYRGEIMVCLHNHSSEAYTLMKDERIAQLVITPYLTVEYEECAALDETERGAGGFGSTGKN